MRKTRYPEGQERRLRPKKSAEPGEIATRTRRASKSLMPPSSSGSITSLSPGGNGRVNSPRRTKRVSSSSKPRLTSDYSGKEETNPKLPSTTSNPGWGWRVILKRSAQRELAALPDQVRDEANDLLEAFREDPFMPNAERMRKTGDNQSAPLPNTWRIYLSGKRYRVIYEAHRRSKKVIILAINRRTSLTYAIMSGGEPAPANLPAGARPVGKSNFEIHPRAACAADSCGLRQRP